MPCSSQIDLKSRLVLCRGWDKVTFQEVKEQRERLLSDPEFDPKFNQLIDAVAVTDLELSSDDARFLVSSEMFSPDSKRAFVAKEPAIYGMARMIETYYSIHSGGSRLAVFQDMASALRWLGLENVIAS